MEKKNRPFRSQESYDAEEITRVLVVPFLRSRGLTELDEVLRPVGKGKSQLISARLPDGVAIRMRVRLCWRRDGRNPREHLYSAAQLAAKTIEGDWDTTLRHIAERDAQEAVTHELILQRDGDSITSAALIPAPALPAVWQRQREVSDRLIAHGEMGRIRKNHAANGQSPTLWLQDDRVPAARAVPAALWNWPGVIDLARLPQVPAVVADDDSLDDYPGLDYSQLGSDGAQRKNAFRSEVKRDGRVRSAVIQRSAGKCERRGCDANRPFKGFLDVHHVLGAENGDRFWNCVALCPNCHREAHLSPDAASINKELLVFAAQFQHSVPSDPLFTPGALS
jgi:5-methylcytosine-specific restriction protein A